MTRGNLSPTIECVGPDRLEGGWRMVIDGLGQDTIVYSFGVGDNIAWEIAMTERFGCAVHAFDPTPMSVEWISKQKLPPKLIYHPEGLSTYDGTQRFYNAFKPGKIDMSGVRPNSHGYHDLPVKRLQTFMRELGHDHIDLLKLDIEGMEYDVLRAIRHLPIKQIIVEFHGRFFRFGELKNWWTRIMLRLAGYKLLDVAVHERIFYRVS
jgi:FkbM family methyltransferase